MIISQVKQGMLAGRKEIHLEKYGGVKEHETHLSYCNGTLAGRLHSRGCPTRPTGSVNTYVGHNSRTTIDYIMAPKYVHDLVLQDHTGGFDALNTSDHVPLFVDLNFALDFT